MDENKLRFGVGVLVISAIGIGIILTFLFGAFPSVLKSEYTLSVVFPSAEGISPNTPVLRDGVRIGRVSRIDLRDDGQGGGVLVTLSMDADKPLTHTYLPRIGSGNFVTGDSKLEFVRADATKLASVFPGDPNIITQPWSDREFFEEGTTTESLMEMQSDLQGTFESIQRAGESVAIAAEQVSQLAGAVQESLGGADSKVDEVADQTIRALTEFEGAAREIRELVGDPDMRSDLERSLSQFPVLIEDARSALQSTEETLDSFERAGNQLEQLGIAAEDTVNNATATFENLEQFTSPLADRGDELVAQVGTTLNNVNTALAEIETFAKSLNNSDGSLRRFLDDDEIYFQVRRTIQNIEDATARVRPILDDVRIFSDKIARDPRQLGVRGALAKRPSGAGLK